MKKSKETNKGLLVGFKEYEVGNLEKICGGCAQVTCRCQGGMN